MANPKPPSMKLLVVSHTHGLWGAQMRFVEYIPTLLAAGIVPTLLAPTEGPFADAFRDAGCEVEIVDLGQRIGLRNNNDGRPGPLALLGQLRDVLGSAWRLRKIIRPFDLVQSHSRTAHLEVALGARLARRRSVIDVHDVVRPGMGRRILGIAARLANVALANSSSTAATLGPNPRNVVIVNPAVALDRFTGDIEPDAQVRADLGGGIDRTLVGVVGRVDPDKRIELLIEAVSLLGRTDVDLSVIGANHMSDDEYLVGLKSLAEERLPGRVTFTGARSDMAKVMASLDVLASACTVEAFGRSILEAQASRTPVVAPDLLGVSDIVEDEVTGWLFRAEDASDLSEAMGRLLDSTRVCGVVDSAFAGSRRLGVDTQGAKLVELYRSSAS